MPDLATIRKQFPALDQATVYFDNAGGSQVPDVVGRAIYDYLTTTYAQLGANYSTSKTSSQVVDDAHTYMHEFMGGAEGSGHVVLGSSSTSLCQMLADCYDVAFPLDGTRDEVIIHNIGHEANIGPWANMRNSKVRWWEIDPETLECALSDLEDLLSERTALVAVTHVSNLLGEIVDLEPIVKLARSYGARVIVDGVAYAPHRAMHVDSWGVDWYVYSTYKVYGPHMACLYGSDRGFADVTGRNLFFISPDDIPYKFELGGVNHEGCAGLLALDQYLSFLQPGMAGPRETVVGAFDRITELERPLQERLISYIEERSDLRLVGSNRTGDVRVPTISFVHESLASPDVARPIAAREIGIRAGHNYAYRLAEVLGVLEKGGVIRASMVHYNTVEEVDRLIEALEDQLGSAR